MRVISTAPVRTADAGGWTDTWFAVRGSVCNVAIDPGVTVTVAHSQTGADGHVEFVLPDSRRWSYDRFDESVEVAAMHDPLLAAACCSVDIDGPLRVSVESAVPPGSGTGSSAAVTVALLAALDAIAGRERSMLELARAAHAVEVGLGWQSGVQDQLASAHGGVHLFSIDYPRCTDVKRLDVSIAALDERLLTVYLGRPHASSAVHESVIAHLEATDSPLLEPLRVAAVEAFDALCTEDLRAYGLALVAAHEGTRRLHPGLVSHLADELTSVAAQLGALGWKVNGAGGEGGSLAVLAPEDPLAVARLRNALGRVSGCSVLRSRVARAGVRVA